MSEFNRSIEQLVIVSYLTYMVSKFRFNQWNYYYEQRQAHDIWGTL